MIATSVATPGAWVAFTAFILALLALDLGVFNRNRHEISVREALGWTGVWVSLALLFGAGVWIVEGPKPGFEYFTGFLIEKALSVDNLFVFLVLFSYFKTPYDLQHRVLYWGILGALVMRAGFILAGAALLERFHWLIYLMGASLIYTGAKLLVQKEDEGFDPDSNRALQLVRWLVPTVSEYHGPAFFVRQAGKLVATPLFVVLITVELTDLVFALDSIPAIFGVTSDPFIVYTSNVFAILGLRSLYFALAGLMDSFHYLKTGLGLVLVFVGLKMAGSGFYHVPVELSLAVVGGLIGGSIALSVWRGAPHGESAG